MARYYLGGVGSWDYGDATEIGATRIRFPNQRGLEESATSVQPGFGDVEVDDPNGDLDIIEWSPFWVDEDNCSEPRIWTGFVYGFTETRGEHQTGAGRTLTVKLIDLQSLLDRRVWRGPSGIRPVETGDARIAWAMAGPNNELVPWVFDNGLIVSDPTDRAAENYIKRKPVDVLGDLAKDSARHIYLIWDSTAAAGEEVTLVSEPATSAQRASTLSLSNVRADINLSTVYPPYADATRERKGEDIYDGVLVTGQGTIAVYDQDTGTTSRYFGAMPGRDLVEDEQRIGVLATAQAQAENLLAIHNHGSNTITVSVKLPDTKVNLIRAGMALDVRFTHFEDYETTVTTKVLTRGFLEIAPRTAGVPGSYQVLLQLSLDVAFIAGGGGGGGGGTPQPPPDNSCAPDYSANIFAAATISDGGGTYTFANPTRANDGDITTMTDQGPGLSGYGNALWLKIDLGSAKKVARILAREGASGNTIWFADQDTDMGDYQWPEDGKGRFVEYSDDGASWTLATFSFTRETDPGNPTSSRCRYELSDPDGNGAHRYWGVGHSESRPGDIHFQQHTGISELEGYECVAGTPNPPRQNQWTVWGAAEDVVIGATDTTFTVPNGFAYANIEVKVDGVLVDPSHIIQSDPDNGGAQLDWAIDSDETIMVRIQGA